MNKSKLSSARVQKTFAAVIAAAMVCGLQSMVWSAEPTSVAPAQTNSPASAGNAVPPETNNVVVNAPLTGAELYSMHCNRCHPERYPTERTAAQWKTIMLHMQVRANIPVSQSRLILKYLQDNSGR